RMESGRDLGPGGDDVGDVRVLGFPQGRRDADDDHVTLLENGEVGGRRVLAGADQRLQILVREIRRARPAQVERGDAVRIVVDAGHGEAGPSEFGGKRKPDISLADDRNMGAVVTDPLLERRRNHAVTSARGVKGTAYRSYSLRRHGPLLFDHHGWIVLLDWMRTLAKGHDLHRVEEDADVEPEREILDVVQVVPHLLGLFLEIVRVPEPDLRPAGDARADGRSQRVVRNTLDEELHVRRRVRPRADKIHVAADDVDELRKLVEP